MSCTCNKGESFTLFINSCEKSMFKTMHVSKTVENC